MNAPQITMIALLAVGAGVALSKHGQARTGNHSFPHWAVGAVIQVGLLYWGGFFA